MARRFGPTLGAGVVVIETPPEKTITPAPLGVICHVGVYEKGDPGELISAPSKFDFLKKLGSYFAGSQAPDAAIDFYNEARGSGEGFFVRVTDGTEVEATSQFYARRAGHGYYAGRYANPAWDEFKLPLITLTAKNGGRWAGRLGTLTDDVAVVATDITETTLITGLTMLANVWKGAKLYLAGVTTKSYEVVSNTTAGVVTVKSDSMMATDLASGAAPTNANWWLSLDTDELVFPAQVAGTRKVLAALWKDGTESESDYFGLELYENGVKVKEYPDLSLDPLSKYYIANVIDGDTSNEWVAVAVNYSGTITPDHRPANWFGRAVEWATDTLTVQIAHVKSVVTAVADPGWVGNFTLPAAAGYADRVRKHQLVITFTAPTTFTVTTGAGEGAEHRALGSGTVGTAFPAKNPYTMGFTVFAGTTAWAIGNVIKVDINPLPVDEDGVGLLTGHRLYQDVGTNSRKFAQIKSNTINEIVLTSAPNPVPAEHLAAATPINTGALVFPLTLVDTTLSLKHSSFGNVALAIAAGPHATAAALATAINAAWQAASGSTGDIAADGGALNILLSLDDSGADTEVGYESFLIVSEANTSLTLALDEFTAGTLGAEFRVQAPTEMRGGYDGEAPADADYLAHADAITSVINRIFGRNKGLVKMAVPGITTTAIQKAFLTYAESRNYQFRIEIPSTIDDDAAAVEYVNDTIGRNDFGVVSYPSYAYVPNPQGEGTVLRTLSGAIHGVEARIAGQWEGYHKAEAGLDAILSNVVKLVTGERQLNEEVLNPQGVNVIKKAKGNFILWGDRSISLDPGWKFKHHREQMSYYENIFREEFDFIVFAINDEQTQQQLITVFRVFFQPEFSKRALRGASFNDAVSIKIDSENNTNLTRALGDLNAEIRLRLADTVERFKISIGKAGIFEDLA